MRKIGSRSKVGIAWPTLLLFLCYLNTEAQISRFSHIGVSEGLSHGWAKCIEKDNQGYLWVGTVNGLNRYDGNEFKVFKNIKNSPNTISDNFIQAIESDQQGNMWIGTYSGGLNRYDPLTETFVSYRNAPKKLNSISDDRIHAITQDSKGRLWVGTARGLDLYDYENDHFNPYYMLVKDRPKFIRGIVACIYEDRDDNIWVGTDSGLYKIDAETGRFVGFSHNPSDRSSLSHPYVTSIYQDAASNIWVGTWGGSVNLFHPEQETFTRIEEETLNHTKLSHNSVLCMTGDRDGHLFIGTEGGGLNVLNIVDHSLAVYLPRVGELNGINSNSIHSIYSDAESGITWIGSYGGGLNFFSRWNKPFAHFKQDQDELNNNSILSIAEASDGLIYVGTDGGGINIVNPKTKQVEQLTHDNLDEGSLMSNAVLALEFDDEQNLWVGTFDGGLDYLPKGANRFQHFIPDPEDPNSISDSDVSSICIAKNGIVWAGTMNGGISQYNPITRTFNNFKHVPGNAASLTDNFISHIFEGANGKFYIQNGKTLDVFDSETSTFSRLDKSFGMILNTPIASLEDSRGNIWVGTREGLFFFDLKSIKYKEFNKTSGLPNNSITGILEDQFRNLWVSTMGGLVKMEAAVQHQDTVRMHTYTKEDGLQGNDFKDMACHKGKGSMLYFGGQNGFNFFYPEKIHLNPVVPQVLFTGFRLFNNKVEFGESEILKKPLNQTQVIHLDYKHNVFSFEFSALNYWQPQKNQYAYIMRGFEKNWNHVGNQNSATYTNLDPGHYTFKVKAANNDGIWNETGESIEVIISPPWWKTTWFRFATIFLLAFTIVAFIRIRLYQLKQRQKELTKEVEARTIEIRSINELLKSRNEEIGIKNDRLTDNNKKLIDQNGELERQAIKIQSLLGEIQELNELKLRFFTNISHELRTPLTLIIGPLEKLISTYENKNRSQKEFGVMHRNALKLLRLINQLLDFRKIESGNIQLQAQKNDIISCIQEVFDTFKFMAERKRIKYRFESEYQHYDLWFDQEKMEKILTNLLSNAFKYTSEGHVLVKLAMSEDEKAMILSISDTGRGIPADQLPKVFDLYYQANNASNLNQAGSGIGLALIKQYIDLHHGKIELTSQIDQGSCFRAHFPIGSGHLDASEIVTADVEDRIMIQSSIPETESYSEEREVPFDQLSDIPLGEKPMLLIVEDNADIRDYIRNSMDQDFQVSEASNGVMGLEKALEITPDLIISDVMMPEMNGFMMCQKLKEDEQTNHIPIVLLTAYSGEEKQWEGFKSGADDYITKPFNIKILQQKLKNITHTREQLIQKFNQSTSLDIQNLSPKETDQKFLKKAIDVINENLDDANLSVDDFSDHFNMSRRNLLRKLKAITGLSVSEFIKSIRLKKSISYINTSDMNISEIAYAVGFSDPKYFSKCFKSQFGKSPKEYKEPDNFSSSSGYLKTTKLVD
ncbi:Signal transduction histidine kinase [Reichenbachiella faecimaris]|uniref:histidine kinase n=1 Tax=Reichenbachiella faecimaris TaxID=692418 RepID=A0A1W2G7X7_REIFA|nr:two-component regulator propeller domain-containing protein [Reichenbachiella faecimaris]SMD32777.1 Signal transduction histidine kinase [Reichenbachiella faecimaris]